MRVNCRLIARIYPSTADFPSTPIIFNDLFPSSTDAATFITTSPAITMSFRGADKQLELCSLAIKSAVPAMYDELVLEITLHDFYAETEYRAKAIADAIKRLMAILTIEPDDQDEKPKGTRQQKTT